MNAEAKQLFSVFSEASHTVIIFLVLLSGCDWSFCQSVVFKHMLPCVADSYQSTSVAVK